MLTAIVWPADVATLDLPRTCTGWTPIAPCTMFWRYDTVFIGTVKTLVNEPFPEGAHPDYQEFRKVTATVTVDETFRGKLGPEVVFEMEDCYFEFEKGVQYLIYTHEAKDGKYNLARTSGPTRLLSEASEDLDYIRSLPHAPPGGRIFGNVYDHRGSVTLRVDNEPSPPTGKMAGVTIYLKSGEKTYQTISDATGHYEFTRVPAGTYDLSTDLPDYLTGARHTVSVMDKGCVDVMLSIQATGSIKGRLVNSNGEPVERAVVSIFSAEGVTEDLFDRVRTFTLTRDETDKNGSFSFVRLRAGHYHLAVNMVDEERRESNRASDHPRIFFPGVTSFKDAKPIILGSGAKLENIEIKLPLLPAAPPRESGVAATDDQ